MVEALRRTGKQELNAEDVMKGKPLPHYVDLGEKVIVDEDKRGLEAFALFPSTDPTIANRKQVNAGSQELAIWPFAHELCEQNNLHDPLATEIHWKGRRKIMADDPVKLTLRVENYIDAQDKVTGILNAEYTSKKGKLLSQITCAFTANKIN